MAKIREMKESEYCLLEDFLYEAIFIPTGEAAPPRSILQKAELRVYVDGFGKGKYDIAYAAEVEGRIIGAVWSRIIDGYGSVDSETPELAISIYKEYRGRGIGKELLNAILGALAIKGRHKVSLAVQKANYAVKLYKKAGFEIIGENDSEYIMIKTL